MILSEVALPNLDPDADAVYIISGKQKIQIVVQVFESQLLFQSR